MSVASFINVGYEGSNRGGTSSRAALVAVKVVGSAAFKGCRVRICAGRSETGYLLNVGQTISESGWSKIVEAEEVQRFSMKGAHLGGLIVKGKLVPLVDGGSV